jgi:hypothetical protein
MGGRLIGSVLWQVVLDLFLKRLEAVSVDVVSASLGDKVSVGFGESGDHCWVGGHVKSAANDVTEEDLCAVSDGLDEGTQHSTANGNGQATSEWSKSIGNGRDGVVNLRVDALDEGSDSGSIGVFRMLADLGIHLVNLLLTVHHGALETVQKSILTRLKSDLIRACLKAELLGGRHHGKRGQKSEQTLLSGDHC